MFSFDLGRWFKSWFRRKVKPMLKRPRFRLHLEELETRLAPALFVWTGGGGALNTGWNNPNNWNNGGAIPTVGAAVNFQFPNIVAPASFISNDNINNLTIGTLTVAAGNYTLSSAIGISASMGNGGQIIINTGATATLSTPLTLGSNVSTAEIINVQTAASLTMTGQLTSNPNGLTQITKQGAGTLILTGSNTTLNASIKLDDSIGNGVVQITNPNALGSGQVTISTNTQLQLNIANPAAGGTPGAVPNNFIVNGAGPGGTGAILDVNSGADPSPTGGFQTTLTGTVTMNSTNGTGNTTIGVSALTGTFTNTSGTTPVVVTTPSTTGLVAGQQVRIAESGFGGNLDGEWTISAVTATTFTLVGSVDEPAAGPGWIYPAAPFPTWTSPYQLTVTGTISDNNTSPYTLTKEGQGTLYLNPSSAAGNTYVGNTVINNGILQIGQPFALGPGGGTTTVNTNSLESGTLALAYSATNTSIPTQYLYYNTVQVITVANGTAASNLQLGYNGAFTTIPYNTSSTVMAANIAAALNGLPTITSITPAAGPAVVSAQATSPTSGVFDLTFGDSLTGLLIPTVSAVVTSGPGAATVSTVSGKTLGQNAIGFQVPNENLVLNGFGVQGGFEAPRDESTLYSNPAPQGEGYGALENVAGANSWEQEITLWSSVAELNASDQTNRYFFEAAVTVGAAANTNLTIDAPITDNGIGVANLYSFAKVGNGRVILTRPGTYSSDVDVTAGALNIRDSNALGLDGLGAKYVWWGASLELQADGIPDSSGLAGLYNLYVPADNALQLAGAGWNGEGALDNVSGVNKIEGEVILDTGAQAGNVAYPSSDGTDTDIGVDPDPDPTNVQGQTYNDLSQLTIDGIISDTALTVAPAFPVLTGGTVVGTTYLKKVGFGELVLTAANDYTGPNTGHPATLVDGATLLASVLTGTPVWEPQTEIAQGWITIENDQALGGTIATTDSLDPPVQVDAGAALMLKQDLNGNDLDVAYNMVLTGTGVTQPEFLNADGVPEPLHPWLNQGGALENLDGANTVTGFITLAGQVATPAVGIGVELDGANIPNPPPSQLTLTALDTSGATIMDGANKGELVKLGSQRLIIQDPGTYTGGVDIQTGVLQIQNNSALGGSSSALPLQTTVESGAALELAPTVPELSGGISDGLDVQFDHLVLDGTGDTTFGDSPLTILADDNLWNGPITLNTALAVTFSGALADAAMNDMTVDNSGLTGVGPKVTATPTTPGSSGVDAVQSLTFGGTITGGTFTLTVNDIAGDGVQNGITTLASTTITGLKSTTGLQVGMPVTAAGLFAANTTITSIGPAAGTIQVSSPALVTTIGTIHFNTTAAIAVPTDPVSGLIQIPVLIANIQAALNALAPVFGGKVAQGIALVTTSTPGVTIQPNSRFSVTGVIDDATSLTPADITVTGGGELVLAANNTYRGTTYVNQGILTIETSQALGQGTTSEVQTVTIPDTAPLFQLFQLSFSDGQGDVATTPFMSLNSLGATLAAQAMSLQNILDELSTIGGQGAGGSVNVQGNSTGTATVFTITYGGSLLGFRLDSPVNPTPTSNTPPNVPYLSVGSFNPFNITVATQTYGSGATVVANGAQLQMQGGISVANEPLEVEGSGAPLEPEVQDVTVGAATASGAVISASAGTPIVISTASTAALTTGETVTIVGVTGNTSANGTWVIAVLNGSTFSLNGSTSSGASTVDTGTWTAATQVGAFSLSFTNPNTSVTSATVGLPVGANANQVALALNQLTSIEQGAGAGGGYVVVNEAGSDVYTVTFEGTFALPAQTNIPQIVATPVAEQILTVTGTTGSYSLTFSSTLAGNTTLNSNSITNLPNTIGLGVGMKVTGAGINFGTTIASIVNATSITISSLASATATGVALTFVSPFGSQNLAPTLPASGAFVLPGPNSVENALNTYLQNTYSPGFEAASAVTLTGTTNVNSETITGLASTAGLSVGMSALGGGTVPGTHITSIVNGTTITVSQFPFSSTTNPIEFVLTGFANVLATTTGNSYVIDFGGTLAGQIVPLLVPGNIQGDTNATVTASNGATAFVTTQVQGGSANVTPIQWFNVGPAPINDGEVFTTAAPTADVAGRVTSVVTDENDPNLIYIATADGGVWKTVNANTPTTTGTPNSTTTDWTPLFDGVSAVQTFQVIGKSGTFQLGFTNPTTGTSSTTGLLNYNATSQQVQSALNGLTSINEPADPAAAGSVLVNEAPTPGIDEAQQLDLTQGSTLAGNTTVGSLTISGLPAGSTAGLTVGMLVTDSLFNIPAGATIASIVNGTTITLNENAFATSVGDVFTFGAAGGSSSFTLSFGGAAATATILFTNSAADATNIQNALNAATFAPIGGIGGAVTVTQTGVGLFSITFGGTLAQEPLATLLTINPVNDLTVTAASITLLNTGVLPLNTYTVNFSGGNFANQAMPALTYSQFGGATIGAGVAGVTVNNGGAGYTDPIVTFSAPTTPGGVTAQGEVNYSGGITGYTVTNFGTTYLVAPLVTITGGGGLGATATAVLTNGVLNITAADFPLLFGLVPDKWAAPPTVTFSASPGGATTQGYAVWDPTTQFVTAIIITNPGSDYPATGPTITISPDIGGLEPNINGLTVVAAGGTVTKVVSAIIAGAPGTGYTSDPTVTIAAPGGGGITADATPIRSGIITSVTILNAGSGYTLALPPTLTFSGGLGAGAVGTPILGGATVQAGLGTNAVMFSGAIAQVPGNPAAIYLGTGDGENQLDSFYGSGVYFSEDYGQTWNLLVDENGFNPLAGMAVDQIVIDSTVNGTVADPIIYVAASDRTDDSHQANGSPLLNAVGVWRYDTLTDLWTNITTDEFNNNPGDNGLAIDGININGVNINRQTFVDNATWSSLYLTTTGQLYAALGTNDGGNWNSNENFIFWTGNPTAQYPDWSTQLANAYQSLPAGQPGAGPAFQQSAFNNGNIEISGSGSTVFAAIANSTISFNPGDLATYAAGGQTILQQTNPAVNNVWTPVAAVLNDYLNGKGDVASAIVAASPTEFFVGGTDAGGQDFVLEYNAGVWSNITVDINGNGPHSGVESMAMDAAGRLVVGTDGGVWRYDPATNVWLDLNGNLAIVQAVSVATSPTNPDDILVAATNVGVAQASNGAQNWTAVDPSLGEEGSVYFDPNNAQVAYAFSKGALQISTDGGKTWAAVEVAGGLALTAPIGLNPSEDNGTPYIVSALSVGPDTTELVFWGNDPLFGGLNLLRVDVTYPAILPATPTAIAFASISDLNPTTLVGGVPTAFTPTQVAISTEQGAFLADPDFPNVTDQGASNPDPATVYLANDNTIIVTKDNGLIWSVQSRTPGPTNTFLPSGAAAPGLSANTIITGLFVDPTDRDHVFAITGGDAGGEGFVGAPGTSRVFESFNAGLTWIDISAGLPDSPAWSIVQDTRSGTLYLGNDLGVYELQGGVLTSTNSWQRFGQGLPYVSVHALNLNQSLDILTAGTDGRSVYQFYLDSATSNTGGLRGASGSDIWNGPVILTGPTTISAQGDANLQNGIAVAQLQILGQISDLDAGAVADTLTKIGAGNVSLGGTNTYMGATVVQQGNLIVDNSDALGDPGTTGAVQEVILTGGVAGSTHFTVFINASFTASIVYTGTALDAQTIENDLNAATFAAVGGAGGSAVVTQLAPGIFSFTFGGTLAGTEPPLNAFVNLGPGVANGSSVGVQELIFSNAVAGVTKYTLSFDGAITASALTYTGTAADAAAIQTALNGLTTISRVGTVSVTALSATVFVVTFSPAFVGVQPQIEPTITAGAGSAYGSVTGGTVVTNGAILQLLTDLNNEPLFLYGNGVDRDGHYSGALENVSDDNTYNGLITLVTNATIGVDAGSGLTIASPGAITDLGGANGMFNLTKEGTGLLTIAAADTYEGNTVVNQGDLNVQTDNALGGIDGSPDAPATFVSSTQGLDHPAGEAFDSSGNLYIANTNGDSITQVTPAGVVSTFVNNSAGLRGPTGLAFDSSGNLYVTNEFSNTITEVTFSAPGMLGAVNNNFVSTGLSFPDGLAFDSSGNLYVTNESDGSITKITFSPPGMLSTVTPDFVPAFSFNAPRAMAFDSSGNLYVANSGSGTISKVSFISPGVLGAVSTFVSFAEGLNLPDALAFDNSGNLYVANQGNNSISKITFSAPGVLGAVTTFVPDFVGLSDPDALAFDGAGNLYIANGGKNTISKVTPGLPNATTTVLDGAQLQLQAPTQTGTTAIGSLVVTGLTSTAQLFLGMSVFGAGIPSGTTIEQISSATSIRLSEFPTASGTVTLTFPMQITNENLVLSGNGDPSTGGGALLNVDGDNTWGSSTTAITLSSVQAFAPETTPTTSVPINVAQTSDTLTIGSTIGEVQPGQQGTPAAPPLTMSSGLTKLGPGTLILTQADTYTGSTDVNDGALYVQNSTSLGLYAGHAVERLTMFDQGSADTFTVSFNGVANVTPVEPVGITAAALQTALDKLTTIGAGGVHVSENIIDSGIDEVQTLSFSNPTLSTTYQLTINGVVTPSISYGATAAANIANLLAVLPAGTTVSADPTDTVFTITFGGALEDSHQSLIGVTVTSGAGTGSAQIAETAAGAGFRTYIYTVAFVGGALNGPQPLLAVTPSSPLLTAAVATAADGRFGTVVASGASLDLDGDPLHNGSTLTVSPNQTLALNGAGIGGTGALASVSGNDTWAGNIILESSSTIGAFPATQLTIGGSIADPVPAAVPPASIVPPDLTKTGAGALVLISGSTYTGNTFIDAGIVTIKNTNSLGINTSSTQALTVNGTNGTFTLFFPGYSHSVTTGQIPFNVTASQLQTYLNSASMLGNAFAPGGGLGTATVSTEASGNTFVITFGGSLQAMNVPLLNPTFFTGNTIASAVPLLIGGQSHTVVASGASVELLGSLPPNLLSKALILNGNGFNGIGAFASAGGASAWDANTIILGSNSSVGAGAGSSLNIQTPISDNFETQELDFNGFAIGDTYTVNFDGENTATLSFNATAATNASLMTTALQNLTTVSLLGGTVTVTASIPGVYQVTFTGNMAGVNWPGMSGTVKTGTGNLNGFIDPTLSSDYGVNKLGAGTVQFSSPTGNDYTGLTNVVDGTLQLNDTGSGFTVNGNLQVGDATVVPQVQTLTFTNFQQLDQFTLTDGGTTPTITYYLNPAYEALQIQNALNTLLGANYASVAAASATTFVITMTGLGDNVGPTIGGTAVTGVGTIGATVTPAAAYASPGSLGAPTAQLEASNQINPASNATVMNDGLFDLNGNSQTLNDLTIIGGIATTDLVGTTPGSLTLTNLTIIDGTLLTPSTGSVTVSGAVTMTGGLINLLGTGSTLNLGASATVSGTSDTLSSAIIEGSGDVELGSATQQSFSVTAGAQTTDLLITAVIATATGAGIIETSPGPNPGRLELAALENYSAATDVDSGDLQVDALYQIQLSGLSAGNTFTLTYANGLQTNSTGPITYTGDAGTGANIYGALVSLLESLGFSTLQAMADVVVHAVVGTPNLFDVAFLGTAAITEVVPATSIPLSGNSASGTVTVGSPDELPTVVIDGTSGGTPASVSGTGKIGFISFNSVGSVGTVNPGSNGLTGAGVLQANTVALGPNIVFFVNPAHTTVSPAPIAGLDYDQLSATTSISLEDNVLEGAPGPGTQIGDQYTIMQAPTITGNLDSSPGVPIANNGSVFLNGQKFTVTYNYSSSPNTVVLTREQAVLTTFTLTSSLPGGSVYGQDVTFTATGNPETGASLATTAQYSTATITGAAWSALTNQVTINAVNTFTPLEQVAIAGLGAYNGTYTILSDNGATFTYGLTTNPGTASGFGAATTATVQTNPIVTFTIDGTETVSVPMNPLTDTATLAPQDIFGAWAAGSSQTVTATFSDDTSVFQSAIANMVTQHVAFNTVGVLESSTTGAPVQASGTVIYGQTATITAAVTPIVAPNIMETLAPGTIFASNPTGNVLFTSTDGKVPIVNPYIPINYVAPSAAALPLATADSATLTVLGTSLVGHGTHIIDASYAGTPPQPPATTYTGDADYSASLSPVAFSLTVVPDQSVVTITSPTAPILGQPATFDVTVTPSLVGSIGIPKGTLTFYEDNLASPAIGTLNYTGGTAVFTTSPNLLTQGAHTIFATFTDNLVTDGNYFSATGVNAGSVAVTVGKATTKVTFNAVSPANPTYLQAVMLTATVSQAPAISGYPPPSGLFTFYDGQPPAPFGNGTGVLLGTGSVNTANGQATITTPASGAGALAVGTHTIYAVYGGDGTYAANDTTLNLTINPAVTTTTLTASPAGGVVFGASATFTADVLSAVGVPPAGSGVTFEANGVVIPGQPVNGVPITIGSELINGVPTSVGVAIFSTAALPAGPVKVTAVYADGVDSNYATSTGTITSYPVTKAPTTVIYNNAITTSTNTTVYGQTVTLSVNVTSPGGVVNVGSVKFFDTTTNTTLGTGTISVVGGVGVATITTTALTAVVSHSITATYTDSTDSYFTGPSTPAVLTPFVVGQAGTAAVVTTSSVPTPGTGLTPASGTGQITPPVVFTATVTTTAMGSTVNPKTGNVIFKDGISLFPNEPATGVPLSGSNVATYTLKATDMTALGLHNITATYTDTPADNNFMPSTSPALQQIVLANSTTAVNPTTLPPYYYGNAVFVDPTVVSNPPGGTPGGTVTITDSVGNTTLYSGAFGSPINLSSLGNLSVATHTITVTYSGDGSFAPSSATATITVKPATTSINSPALSSSVPGNSEAGQPVTFTATLSVTSGGTPGIVNAGVVTFYDGTKPVQTVNMNGVGNPGTVVITPIAGTNNVTIAYTPTTLTAGTHTISAKYGGSTDFSAPLTASNTVTQKVLADGALGTLSPTQWTAGEFYSAKITYTEGAAGGTGTAFAPQMVTYPGLPAGLTASVFSNTSIQISGTTNATGTFPFTLNVTDFAGAVVSKSYSITINAGPSLSTPVQGTFNTAYSGAITISGGTAPFTITGVPPGLTITGATKVGSTFTLNSRTITLTGKPTAGGTYTLSVTDAADANTTIPVIINAAATTITLISSPHYWATGVLTAFTATVTTPSGAVPTGSITYTVTSLGGFNSGTSTPITLSGGKANFTFTFPANSPDMYTVTVNYTPPITNANFQASSIAPQQNVLKQSLLSMVASPNPVTADQLVTFTATLTGNGIDETLTNNGTVNFYANGMLIGAGTVTNSGANSITYTITYRPLNTGTLSITAMYNGDSIFDPAILTTPYSLVVKAGRLN